MERDLEKYLQALNSDRSLRDPKEAESIIDKIYDCFKQEQSQFSIGLLIGLLLEENNGIFTFLWNTCTDFKTVSPAASAIMLLDFLVIEFQKCTEPYFKLIFEKCLYLLNTKLARIKELSLKVIKNLISSNSIINLDLASLISKLELLLEEGNKLQDSVAEQVFSILGYIFERYPESIKTKTNYFFYKIFESLKHEITVAKKVSRGKTKAAFEALDGYLVNYSLCDDESSKKIYDYLKIYSKYQPKTRQASHAALKVIQNHWSHFSNFIFNDRDFWKSNIKVWLSQNSDDHYYGFYASGSLYSTVALFAKQNSSHSEVVKSYLKDLKEILQLETSNPFEKRSALVGVKLFVLTGCLPNDDLISTYRLILNFVRTQEQSNVISFLPLSIECISAFVFKFHAEETLGLEHLAILQRLSVNLINQYPKIGDNFQPNALAAIEKSFYTLSLCSLQILENHIDKVLYQGLIRTCSYMTVADLEILKESGEADFNTVTYKSYLSLWNYYLNLTNTPNLPVGGSFELKKGVAIKVFGTILDSLIKIISKLDYTINVKQLGTDLEAYIEKPSDLQIFVNCVDLYQDLIPVTDAFNLVKWMPKLFQVVINLSLKNPLVAGFYKIITTTLKVADAVQFFEGDTENLKCFHLISKFLEKLIIKVDQYKGDLQLACLLTILAAPVPLIEGFIEKIIPVLQVAVQLGRSYFPLLTDLIEALERWNFFLAPEIMRVVMQKILPNFDLFFQSQYFRGSSLVNLSIEGKKLKKKLIFKDSELLVLQKRFLMFLGNLDLNLAMNLIELPDTLEEEKSFDDNHLIYVPPFINEKTEINLDEILPRIMDLAVSCNDRQTRLIACELLYSAVMVFFGNISQISGGNIGLFRKIIKTCLVLGSDSDSVVYQIYEPLMFQITHYLSGKKTMYLKETQALIDILMDYVTRPYDPAVRDLSGLLICEFTAWTIKQLTPEELKATPDGINKILNNIFALALHPSYNKRIGAAVIFNKIYSVLREEDYILDAYWFQLFYHFVESLRMCNEDEDSTEIMEAIQHVKRPLVERSKDFNKISQHRIVPAEFTGGLLSDLVKWTFERSCDLKSSTRRIVMNLVEQLAPLVRNCNSLVSFVKKQGLEKSVIIMEKPFDQKNSSERHYIEWLNHQGALFEYCSWLIKQNILTPTKISLLGVNNLFKKYILQIQEQNSKSFAIEFSKRESVIYFLNLLEALKERSFYFCNEIWDLIKLAVFRPSKLGFDLNQVESTKDFFILLTGLLKYFSEKLPQYNRNYFYENLEQFIVVPVLHYITRKRTLNINASEFLFGLKVVANSGVWEEFIKETFFSIDGGLIVKIIFRSLFIKEKRNVYALSLEPSCRAYLEELLNIGFQIGIPMETMFNFIKDSEVVIEEDTGKSITKGEFFLLQFKSTIFCVLESYNTSLVEWVLCKSDASNINLLIYILGNEKCSDANRLLPMEVFRRWNEFEKLELRKTSPEYKRKILLRLALSSAQAIGTPGCLKTSQIADLVYDIFESGKFFEMDADEMEGVLDLLPYLSSFGEKLDENSKLETSLSKFLADHGCLRYEESQNSKRNTLQLFINGLLKSLNLTGSLVLLKLALKVTGWFETFCKKEAVDSALMVFSKFSNEYFVSAVKLAYHFCFNEDTTKSSASLVFKWFLNPFLNSAPNAVVYEVVVENLEGLFKLITTPCCYEKRSNAIRIDIIRKTCVAGILKIFVSKLSSKEMDKIPKEKKCFIEKLIVSCFPLLRQAPPNAALKDRYRRFMCEVFNMICCIISARCTNPKFYKLFIFDERGSVLFVTVDPNLRYPLAMDFDVIPKRKKFSTLLRKTVTKELQKNTKKTLKSVKYVQTNTLFSSSLKEDVTKFDLAYSSIRAMDSVKDSYPEEFLEIELEADSLNNHECMASLVAVITKMVQDNITPLPTTSDEIDDLPCWLTFFLSVLKNSEFSRNLKLLVVKAIYNVQSYVKFFAKEVFSDILDFILNFFVDDPINYLLIDLIEMLIDWKYVPAEEICRTQLTNLVELVIKKSDFIRKDIVKSNLEVLKTMIEVWKDALYCSYFSNLVFERLAKSIEEDFRNGEDQSDGETYLNVHTCGILLSNGISSWKEGSHKEFLDLLLKHFNENNKNKQIFAEICGLTLKHLEKVSVEDFKECEELVSEKISSKADCWLQLLYGVHKHYTKICSKFIFKIFSSAWRSTDSLISERLEMLLSHISTSEECEDDTFIHHAHAFLIDMLNLNDVNIQIFSLKIADKLFEKLEEHKAELLVKEVFELQKSSNSEVRKFVYKIAVNYYLKEEKDCDLKFQGKIVLLKGLTDSDFELEKFCVKFWRDHLNFLSPYDALIKVFQEMYSPEVENIFLCNIVKILIDCAATSDAFKKSIFLRPISHLSRFQKRDLILGTKKNYLSGFMSAKISTNLSVEHIATLKANNTSFLRPTVSSLNFSPTVQATSEIPSSNVGCIKDLEIPKNPFRRRFYKTEEKTNYSFRRWQMQKKKKEAEQEEKSIRKIETQVDIFGEYRAGDYPDIEISHSQILKPLDALAVRDPQIARQFLVSFFSGLTKSIKDEDKIALLSETQKCFKIILQTSTCFDPGVFGFVFEIILKYCDILEFDCEELTNAVVSSNCLSLGVLIIEKIISKNEGLEIKLAKRQRGCEDPQDKRWLELAKLYRSLDENDVLSGIFLDKLKVEGHARSGICSETLLDWSKAAESYRNVLGEDTNSNYSEFYTESYFLCLSKLSNWSHLNECIRTTVDHNLNDLWKNYNLLAWFLKSQMMISLGSDSKDFLNILEEFSKKKYKLNILSTNFGEELAVFDWLSGKLQKASYRINRLCLDFLAGWSHSNRWCFNLRATKLANLQTIAELSNILKTLSEGSRTQLEQNVKICEYFWEKNVPIVHDNLTLWDVKLRYRREFLKQCKEQNLIKPAIKSNLALAKVALNQNNLSLAKECLSEVKVNFQDIDAKLKAEYEYCMNLGKMVVAKLKMSDVNDGLKMYLNVWRGISNQITSAMETDSEDSMAHLFKCNFILGQLVSSILPSVTKKRASSVVLKVISTQLNSSENLELIIKALKAQGLEYFGNSKELAGKIKDGDTLRSSAHLELSKYLLKFSDLNNFSDFEKLAKNLLKAMSLGNPEARQLFGCVLNKSHFNTKKNSFDDLIAESNVVPSWMFLMWINQILANLTSELFSFLKNIVLRIAEDYPNAIRYPFKLSQKRFDIARAEVSTFSQQLAVMLLNDKVYEQFLNSMNFLGPPDLILRYNLEKILKMLEEDTSDSNNSEIQSALIKLHEVMFSSKYAAFRGSVYNYWENFKQPLEEVMSGVEEKSSMKNKIKDLLASTDAAKLPSKRTLKFLKSYSPWLGNFHSIKEETSLELPGQYCGNRKPIKKYIVTVSSFKNDVIVFNSKCRPMRISILGNDAIVHKFLVKFGEDLRQDERIQQVFGHFNHILRKNKQTRFSVETYKVIPLSFSLGMIEWIDNNVSFHEMIENSLGNDSDLIGKAQVEHLKFLAQGCTLGDSMSETVAAHLAGYAGVKRDAAISKFNFRVQEFPQELLKKSFWGLSTSPEHFVYLRGNFATSHAVMCLTHWLVGIGDRHLENTLVSTKTGRVLGIDFGCAFGFATQFLTPPELIPFRLSPQILNLTNPLNESGWIKQTMISCLRVFREEHFGLLSILEVFVLEPVLDWLEHAKRHQRWQAENSELWNPRQKILMVQEKLNGANPVSIFEKDLKTGHIGSKYLDKYLEVLKGVSQYNIRTGCNKEGLTEEEQVECLIDLATDRHVLSKTYIGWNPWL